MVFVTRTVFSLTDNNQRTSKRHHNFWDTQFKIFWKIREKLTKISRTHMNTFYLYLRKDAVFNFMFFLLLFFDGSDLFTLVIQLYSKHIIGKGNNKQMLENHKINESYYGLLEASVAVMQSRSQSPLYTFSREEERGTWGWGYIAVSQPRESTIKAYSSR